MRLADIDAIIADIEETIETSGCVNHEKEIIDCVLYAKTIDAVPVVHGKWEPEGDGMVKCSVCGDSFVVEDDEGWVYEPTNYCGNCGAKMDADDVKEDA